MSKRHDIANRIAERIREEKIINPYGGDVELASDKRCYTTLFSLPAILDGAVQVFSPKFILVTAEGPLGLGFNAVFDQEVNALEAVLCIAQINGRKRYDADQVPRRKSR